MPELPEVETTVRALRQPLTGRTIVGIWNNWPRHIATSSPMAFKDRIRGQQIKTITRRAKYLVFHLDSSESLIIHLKMSGHLSVVAADAPRHAHVHTIFRLDNGRELRFKDQRKFGRVYLVSQAETVLGKLGPEPLEASFTVNLLTERLDGRSRALKPLLLDQGFIAGVGNIYADEALFYARLHPTRKANTLDPDEVTALHVGIQKALKIGVEKQGASISLYRKPDGSRGSMQNEFVVYDREGKPCRQCGELIHRMRLNGRSSHYCPACQK